MMANGHPQKGQSILILPSRHKRYPMMPPRKHGVYRSREGTITFTRSFNMRAMAATSAIHKQNGIQIERWRWSKTKMTGKTTYICTSYGKLHNTAGNGVV